MVANTGAPNEVCSGYRWYGSLAASVCCSSTGYAASPRSTSSWPWATSASKSPASTTRARRCGRARRSRSTAGRRRSRGRTPWPRPRPARTPPGPAGRSPGRCPSHELPQPVVRADEDVGPSPRSTAWEYSSRMVSLSRPTTCTATPVSAVYCSPSSSRPAVRDSSAHTVISALGSRALCAPLEQPRARGGGATRRGDGCDGASDAPGGRRATTRRRAAAARR